MMFYWKIKIRYYYYIIITFISNLMVIGLFKAFDTNMCFQLCLGKVSIEFCFYYDIL